MAGREYATTDMSARSLHEVHLPPFEAAVEAGVATMMPAFTELGGVPMTRPSRAADGLSARDELGFDGVLISDYNAIAELIRHGVAADLAEAAALALKAGVDIDMMADAYSDGLPVALERGLVTMEEIDAAVRRVLKLKERLGLFEDPYRAAAGAESAAALRRRRQLAREAASRAVVLLKNENARAAACRRPPGGDRAPGRCRGGNARLLGGGGRRGRLRQRAGGLASRPAAASRSLCAGRGHRRRRRERHRRSGIALCDGADAILLCLGRGRRT